MFANKSNHGLCVILSNIMLERLRIKLGVEYSDDKSNSVAMDGSLADMITCYRCAPIWWGLGLTLLLLFAPDWLYFLVVLPLSASAFVMVFEMLVYRKYE